jgi:lipoyl synthase
MDKARPDWLKVRLKVTDEFLKVEKLLQNLALTTVCHEANCPNVMECFGKSTATFLILGRTCTRNCTFCDVQKGVPQAVDRDEPRHIALAAKELGLKHVVVTSVTRDDLPDGGAGHFANVIECLRQADATVNVEVLIPDFRGNRKALATVLAAAPFILNHNLETVPRLYPAVRPMASYQRSLELLAASKRLDARIMTKSGIMVGLGENRQEVIALLGDLQAVDCDLLTIGQYLAPSAKHHPVMEYIHPDIFAEYKRQALAMGFKYVAAGPLVRSSYHARELSQNV